VSSAYKRSLILLPITLGLLAFTHVLSGKFDITFSELVSSFTRFDPNDLNHVIIQEFRVPRTLTAILAGASLSLAGMLMQTLFQNPLAGPYILGINSGAAFTVALGTLTGISFFQSDAGLLGSALIGAFIFGLIILTFSFFLRNIVSLLLIGIMIGSFTSAITSILLSISTPENMKIFTLWGLGSLQKVESGQIVFIFISFVIGVLLLLTQLKGINALVLGENAASSLGINLRSLRIAMISITALLAGMVTAFCGPISFVGLAIPNLSRIIFKTANHRKLTYANTILGAHFLLIADLITIWFEPIILIPINAITALIGAPFIMLIIIKKLK